MKETLVNSCWWGQSTTLSLFKVNVVHCAVEDVLYSFIRRATPRHASAFFFFNDRSCRICNNVLKERIEVVVTDFPNTKGVRSYFLLVLGG